MSCQFSDPVNNPDLQQILSAFQAEREEREQATTALERKNAELYSELQRRLAESESFNRVLVSLLQKTVLEQVLDIVCAEAQGLSGATGSAVLLVTDQAWLEVKHRLGKPLAAVEPVPVDGSLAGRVMRHGEPVVLNDPATLERAQVYQWPSGLRALLAVPLHVNGGVIGVLDVVNKAGGFTAEDVSVMSIFATQAAMAIEHARLQQQAEQLAVLAEWMGEKVSKENSEYFFQPVKDIDHWKVLIDDENHPYHTSFDALWPVWIRFRDWKVDKGIFFLHNNRVIQIRFALTSENTPAPAFELLVEGVEWINSLKTESK